MTLITINAAIYATEGLNLECPIGDISNYVNPDEVGVRNIDNIKHSII